MLPSIATLLFIYVYQGVHCSVRERVVVITGAAQGIGQKIFYEFAKEPFASIICVDRSAAACRETMETAARMRIENSSALGNLTTQMVAYGADLAIPENIKNVADNILADFGRVDVLVNNGGITRDGLAISMSDEDWEEVINTNLNAMFFMTKPFISGMIRRRWGRIINMSSIVALYGNTGQTNYAASKAAVIAFTKTLAKEMGSRNILSNAIAPGFIVSPMTEMMKENAKNKVLERNPSKRFGKPEEVAALAVFLASDGASYINGAVIPITGGQTL